MAKDETVSTSSGAGSDSASASVEPIIDIEPVVQASEAQGAQEFGSHTAEFMKQSKSSHLQQVESFTQPPTGAEQVPPVGAQQPTSGNSPYDQPQAGYSPYGQAPQGGAASYAPSPYGSPQQGPYTTGTVQPQPQPQKSSKTGMIVGIVIGALALCCICCVGSVVLFTNWVF